MKFVPIGVLYKHFSSKHDFHENLLSENRILLSDVNEFLPLPVLSTFLDLRICAKFGVGRFPLYMLLRPLD